MDEAKAFCQSLGGPETKFGKYLRADLIHKLTLEAEMLIKAVCMTLKLD